MLALSSSCTFMVRSNTLPPSYTCDTTLPERATLMNSENSGRGIPYLASISRLGLICNWGRSICCSKVKSAIPSIPWMASLICPPMLYNLFRSFPNSLMAIFAFVPESMASIRWEIGWPISMFTPFSSPSRWRTSAKNSSRERSSSSKGASISETFTPRACSSNSARPVLRATVCISGISRRIFSAIRPMLSDSSREIPGMVLMLIVSDPSLNGGRKLRPSPVMMIIVKINRAALVPITTFLWRRAHSNAFLYHTFKVRDTKGSFSFFFSAFLVVSI